MPDLEGDIRHSVANCYSTYFKAVTSSLARSFKTVPDSRFNWMNWELDVMCL